MKRPFHKVLVANRGAAGSRIIRALQGVKTHIRFILRALRHSPFRTGAVHTGLSAEIAN